jgi:hypothetical protein
MKFLKYGFEVDFTDDDDIDPAQFGNMGWAEFLGLVFHGQQQGANTVTYNGYPVALTYEKTDGLPITNDTEIIVTIKYSEVSVLLGRPNG